MRWRLLARHYGRVVVDQSVRKDIVREPILVRDLKRSISICGVTHEVEPPLGVTLSTSPMSTQKSHNCVRHLRILNIFTRVVCLHIEVVVHIVGDALDHVHCFAFRILALDDRGFNESALGRMAGHVAEVLPEVVVAGGTGTLDQGPWQLEIPLKVFELAFAAAQVRHTPVLRYEMWTDVLEDLERGFLDGFGGAGVGAVEDVVGEVGPVGVLPALVVPHAVTILN